MSGHAPSPETLKREVRILDPAYRDQDGTPWRGGRFAERVRREWNQIRTAEIEAADGDMDALAQTIFEKVGGKLDHIQGRLQVFMQMETGTPVRDSLVRPGSPF